ncbi:hypothetical protein [Corynebacterium kalidii]|uniref:Uncharacterized protein n=1 Tax=Corynebacterium kalidii TaxID=2931982 RepID=A0A9X1WHB1_9CORY|nr:hypothetical protein [Corynebacterium kalidii]MCJ7859029.1 hypothetical protein [Corynebacterium kalidii]
MTRQVPSWSRLLDLMAAGRRQPVSGVVVVAGETDRRAYPTAFGLPVARVPVPVGEYAYVRDGACFRLDQVEGSGLLACDGISLVWRGMEVPGQSGVESDGAWELECASPGFFDGVCLDRLLDRAFPAGEIRPGTWLGRDVWRVPGLPDEVRDHRWAGHGPAGDLREPREMVVDADTGVVLRLSRGTGTAEYVEVEFPSVIDVGEDFWTPSVDMVEESARPVEAVPQRCPRRAPATAVIPDPAFGAVLDSLRVPSPGPLPDGHRSIRVHGTRRWSVGETVEMQLEFTETDGDAAPVVAYAELRGSPDTRRAREPWRVILHGDGWSAGWWTEEPVTGYVERRGTFSVSEESMYAVTPTRGNVHSIRLRCREAVVPGAVPGAPRDDAVVHELDVAQVDGCLPYYISHDETVMATTTSVEVVIDLEDVPPPAITEGPDPRVVREFGVTADRRSGERTLWWTPEPTIPVLYWRVLTTGGAGGFRSACIVAAVEATRADPVRIEVDPDGCGGTVSCAGRTFGLRRWWNLGHGEPEVLTGRDAPGWRCGEWSIDYRDGVLVRSDESGSVVERSRPEPGLRDFRGVGPWTGCVSGTRDGVEFRLLDPVTLTCEAVFHVRSTSVCTQWVDGELWLADGELRVMTRESPGQWTERPVTAGRRRSR